MPVAFDKPLIYGLLKEAVMPGPGASFSEKQGAPWPGLVCLNL